MEMRFDETSAIKVVIFSCVALSRSERNLAAKFWAEARQ